MLLFLALSSLYLSIVKLKIEAKREQMLEGETRYRGCLILRQNI